MEEEGKEREGTPTEKKMEMRIEKAGGRREREKRWEVGWEVEVDVFGACERWEISPAFQNQKTDYSSTPFSLANSFPKPFFHMIGRRKESVFGTPRRFFRKWSKVFVRPPPPFPLSSPFRSPDLSTLTLKLPPLS